MQSQQSTWDTMEQLTYDIMSSSIAKSIPYQQIIKLGYFFQFLSRTFLIVNTSILIQILPFLDVHTYKHAMPTPTIHQFQTQMMTILIIYKQIITITPMAQSNKKKSISGTDTEQQLKAYCTLLDQYNQHINSMPAKYFPESYDQLKNHILEQETYLQQFYNQSKFISQMLISLTANNVEMLNQISREHGELKIKLSSLYESIEEKNLCIEQYQEKLEKSTNQITSISLELDGIRQDNLSLHHQIDQKEIQIETDRNQLKKTFLKVEQASQMDKQMVQQLYDTQQTLRQQINQLENQKILMEKRYSELQEQNSKNNRKIKKLQQEIESLNNQIGYLKSASENTENIRKISTENAEQQGEEQYHRESFTSQIRDRSKTKLSEDAGNYLIPSNKEIISSFRNYSRKSQDDLSDIMSINQDIDELSVLNENVQINKQETNSTVPQKKGIQILDPYYSHFLLTSQSIKIKEDCEDMLNVDMKPFYKEVIGKRIPMHLWDQWIKNRLREVIKRSGFRS